MKVSLLLPTKDRADRLERAVNAILAQDHDDWELFIDNGGGPIPTFDDPRITVLQREGRWGARCMNRMAELSSGDILHFAADDDVMLAGTLSDVVETFETVHWFWTYGVMQYMHDGKSGSLDGGAEWDAGLMQCGNIAPCPTVFWSRAIWNELGPFDTSWQIVFDWEMWSRFGSRHEPFVRQHVDYLYEVHDGSTTATCQQQMRDEIEVLRVKWDRVGFGNR